jgi:probable HAF family extracellular repeat protein
MLTRFDGWQRRTARPSQRNCGRRLTLEELEARCLLTTYSETYLGSLGGPYSWANAVNDAGQVVGAADIAGSYHEHAYLYSDGVMTDLGTLGGDESVATAINNHGIVVGWAETTLGLDYNHAFVYRNGVMHDVNPPGVQRSVALGINDAGQVVGDLVYPGNIYRGFLYSQGVLTVLGTFGGDYSEASGINNAGQVVGLSNYAPGVIRAYRYSDGVMTDLGTLPDGQFSAATRVNDAGQIIGWSDANGNYNNHAFLDQDGVMTDLGTLGGDQSVGSAINAAGQVVGWSNIPGSSAQLHGYLYSDGVMTDLNALIHPHSRYSVSVADGINDQGVIVGTGTDLPWPSYFALLLTPDSSPTPNGVLLPDPVSVQVFPAQSPLVYRSLGIRADQGDQPGMALAQASTAKDQPTPARSPAILSTSTCELAAIPGPLDLVVFAGP